MTFRLRPLYFSEAIASFCGAMVGIFIPIYLLTLGYSLTEVFIQACVFAVTVIVVTMIAGHLSARVPLKILMMSSIPFFLVLLSLLAAARTQHYPTWLFGVVAGAQGAAYAMPFHSYFTLGSKQSSVGQQLGMLIAFPQLVRLGAPLLAGVMAGSWGFNSVFLLAAILATLAVIPISQLPNYTAPVSFNVGRFFSYYYRHRSYFWLEVVKNIQEELEMIIWPIAVYLTVRSTIGAGAAATIISAGSAIFTYLLGKSSDRRDRFKLLHLGAVILLALWLVRLFPLSPVLIFAVSTVVGFAVVLINIPFQAFVYNLARVNNPVEFMMFREFAVGLARVIVYTTGIVLVANIQHLFWLAIAAFAVFALLPKLRPSVSTHISQPAKSSAR